MELTEQGRILLEHIKAILFHVKKIEADLKKPPKASAPEPLRIGGSYAASAVLLPSLVTIFKKKHSTTPVLVRTGSTQTISRMLLSSEVEIGLINENPANSNLIGEPFREEKLVFFAPPNHPLARKPHRGLADLNSATLVGTVGKGPANATEKILKGFVHQGLRANITIRCSTPETVKALVKKGTGVGILFGDTVKNEIQNKIFTPLEFPGLSLFAVSYIVHCRNRRLSPSAREFLKMLRKQRAHSFRKVKAPRDLSADVDFSAATTAVENHS
jgi:DNA-binding transcriptional LysR family regulator